jgi:lipopolysaccharide export system protein LptA
MLGRPGLTIRPVAPVRPTPPGEDELEFRFSTVTIHGVSGGKVVWKVHAKHFEQMKDRPVFRVTGLQHAFVENTGQQPLTVTAEVLEQNSVTGDIVLSGAVTVLGQELTMRTPMVTWSSMREVLQFPQQFAAQVGEYTLSTTALASYDVKAGQLICSGPVLLAAGGNTLRAMGITANGTGSFTLIGPVTAELDVTNLDAWADGQALPPIPRIPEAIERRYRDAMEKKTPPPPGRGRPIPGKGVRP